MSVPDVAVAGALLAIARSATRWAVVVAIDELLPALVSSAGLRSEERRVGKEGRVAAGLMCTTIVKGWVASAASVQTLQLTVPAVVVQPALAETRLTWSGSTSVSVQTMAVGGWMLVVGS